MEIIIDTYIDINVISADCLLGLVNECKKMLSLTPTENKPIETC